MTHSESGSARRSASFIRDCQPGPRFEGGEDIGINPQLGRAWAKSSSLRIEAGEEVAKWQVPCGRRHRRPGMRFDVAIKSVTTRKRQIPAESLQKTSRRESDIRRPDPLLKLLRAAAFIFANPPEFSYCFER